MSFMELLLSTNICLSVGTGGFQPRPSCVPNPCHPGVKCTETPQGIVCGPCPDGMEGNGTECTDADEVCTGRRKITHGSLRMSWCERLSDADSAPWSPVTWASAASTPPLVSAAVPVLLGTLDLRSRASVSPTPLLTNRWGVVITRRGASWHLI